MSFDYLPSSPSSRQSSPSVIFQELPINAHLLKIYDGSLAIPVPHLYACELLSLLLYLHPKSCTPPRIPPTRPSNRLVLIINHHILYVLYIYIYIDVCASVTCKGPEVFFSSYASRTRFHMLFTHTRVEMYPCLIPFAC